MSLSSRDVLLLQMDWIWWRKNAEVFLSYIFSCINARHQDGKEPAFFHVVA